MKRTGNRISVMLLSSIVIASFLLVSCGTTPTPTPAPIVVQPNPVSGNQPGQTFINILINSVNFTGNVSNTGNTGNLRLIMVTSDDSGHADALYCPYSAEIPIHQGDNINPCHAGLAYPENRLQGNLYVMFIAVDVKDNNPVAGYAIDKIANALSDSLVGSIGEVGQALLESGATSGGAAAVGSSVAVPGAGTVILVTAGVFVASFIATQAISAAGNKVKDFFLNNYVIGSQTFVITSRSNWSNGQQISASSSNGQVTFNFGIQESNTAAGQVVEAAPTAPIVYPTATQVIKNTTSNSEEENYTDPGDFARWYFTAVWKERNYDYLWTLSTPSFQSAASSGGYNEFTSWWGSVDKADISNVSVLNNDGHYASIRVVITFHLHDGRVLQNRQYDYDLVFNSDRQTWMFDYR